MIPPRFVPGRTGTCSQAERDHHPLPSPPSLAVESRVGVPPPTAEPRAKSGPAREGQAEKPFTPTRRRPEPQKLDRASGTSPKLGLGSGEGGGSQPGTRLEFFRVDKKGIK